MINAEELLKPISADKPCGEDLSYDPGFQELEVMLRGKPEQVMGDATIPAEDPDWKAIRERCLELWEKSHDLRIITALSLAAIKTEGMPGVKECLGALKGLVEGSWEPVYPLLDAADGNDPTQRVNIIAALATQVGTYGDPMRFLERLREAPLTNSPQMGRYSLADALRGESGEPGPDGKPAPGAGQIEAAFRDTPPDEIAALNETIKSALTLAKELDDALTKAVGADKAPDLSLLPKELSQIQQRLAPYLPAGAVAAPAEVGAAHGAAAGAGGQPITGEIQSRQDVLRMIDKICDYYKRTEPSSPVPFILRRAHRLAEMDFMQIIGDLNPDGIKDIQRITGEKTAESE
jgi:type VI secretion system protein ImpA